VRLVQGGEVSALVKVIWAVTLIMATGCSKEIPEDWDEPVNVPPVSKFLASVAQWTKPFPAFRVIGNLYGVGGYDLGVFLIATEDGHILINTGVEGSFQQIAANVASLGYAIEDVKILLSMQAHWDHVAEFARIKTLTNAQVWATADDAMLLEDGGKSDPSNPTRGARHMFRPVKVDRLIADGDVITLGNLELRVHEHPGHTPGSTSYSMRVIEDGRPYNVAIVNMGTINPGVRLLDEPSYPGIDEDFAKTFSRQKAMLVDVWVSAHAGFYRLHQKYQPEQIYNAKTFYDPQGYLAAIDQFEQLYLQQRQEELAD